MLNSTASSARSGIIAAGLLALAFSSAVPALAAPPEKGTIDYTFETTFTDPCGFEINVQGHTSGSQTAFFDKKGVLTTLSIHQTEEDVFFANGTTLFGLPYKTQIEIQFDKDGVVTQVVATGGVAKIVLPNGHIYSIAGRTDYLQHDGTFLLSPDFGKAGNPSVFCAAFAP